MRKIIVSVLVAGLVIVTGVYVYTLLSRPFDTEDAEEIYILPTDPASKEIILDEKVDVVNFMKLLNQSMKKNEAGVIDTSKPDYNGQIKMNDDHYEPFQLWMNGDQKGTIFNNGNYYQLTKSDSRQLFRLIDSHK
ncbi:MULTISPECIES: hypothetical protein [Bacillus]|uniref:YhfM-like domain-containing protein n=2 Tax=Bacillus TaxID=1386 RepID=A0A0M3R917_9BACI|nr:MULTISPECIES: hypothetical protein [Bacillus]ALC80646.1 hypothetical protein AM592_02885 [Bacillus gobiensis]MBP1079531.1 hypothetical protein [Bacillus capparidis]MED1094933.1 hypothetical protein [Bacillus capparidis]